MEQRKVISLGKSSMAVTMPIPWLEMNGISRGDFVSLDIQSDGSLVINPSNEPKEGGREIHLLIQPDESEESIIRRIIGCYLNGFAVMKLTSGRIFSEDQQTAIRSITSSLYMMVVESKASSIVLQTLVDETRTSVEMGIRRIHAITHGMCEDILLALRDWDEGLARSVVSLEDDVDQLMFLILRQIRWAAIKPSIGRQLELDPLDLLDYQTLVHRIERIADHATNIGLSLIYLLESDFRMPEKILNVFLEAAESTFLSFDEAVNGFLDRDVNKTEGIIENQRQLMEMFREVTPLPYLVEFEETSLLSNVIIIRDSIKNISHHTSDIAELTIDRACKSPQ
jgi:phosphate uptake regulator